MSSHRRSTAKTRPDGGPSALLRLQSRLESLGYRVTLHLLAPGTTFGAHCACEDRIDAVFSGQLRIVIGDEAHVLGPGDWQRVPVGASMSAEVIGDEPVLGLDAVRE